MLFLTTQGITASQVLNLVELMVDMRFEVKEQVDSHSGGPFGDITVQKEHWVFKF